MKSAYSILAVLLILPVLHAEDDIPSDAQRVSEQRAAAIDKINKTYVQELEKLKVNYTKQGNLDAANKIVKMIEKIKGENFIGKWKWGNGVIAEIKSDGNAKTEAGTLGKWTVKQSILVIEWANGSLDSFDLPPVDGVMTGKARGGTPWRAVKVE